MMSKVLAKIVLLVRKSQYGCFVCTAALKSLIFDETGTDYSEMSNFQEKCSFIQDKGSYYRNHEKSPESSF